jgi:pimeloyl-ACP methyl ester carboxylesterase
MPAPQLHDVMCPGPAGEHRMAYWQWGPSDAPHAVVCVHGLSRQGRDFDVLAQALLGRAAPGSLRVICPDVAGRGHSEWLKDPMHYQVPTYAGDMLALLHRLQGQAPMARLDWVGTSMGGLIGMALCGTPGLPLPVPVSRLVLNDVGPSVEWSAIERFKAYVGQPVRFSSVEEGVATLAALSPGFGPHTPEQWRALSLPMLRQLPDGGWGLHYDPGIGAPIRVLTEDQARQAQALAWEAWDRTTARTLVLRGAESDLFLRATAQAMAQRGPRARVIEFQGVGHAPTLVASDQVEAVASFLFEGE